MAGRILISISACLALCAVAVVGAIERGFTWLFSLLPVQAPAFAFAGQAAPAQLAHSFADPHVLRHEAAQSRRAAARGI